MSHINYDFLSESVFFSERLKDNFVSMSEKDLRKELSKYRNHVMANMPEIKKEIIEKKNKVQITIESFENLPDEDMLKQLALYIDCVLIADPVFEMTELPSEASEVMIKHMGMNKEEDVDRYKLIESLKYMKKLTMLVVCDYVKFIPLSILHEAPKEIPIRVDKNNFNDCLPADILNYLKTKVRVYNTEPSDEGLRILTDSPLKADTIIYLNIPECENRSGEVVQYMEINKKDLMASSGGFKLSFGNSYSISDEKFRVWVNQSINTVSQRIYTDIYNELYFAQSLNSMYMARSQFTSDLLSLGVTNSSMQSKIANMALKVDVPIFQGVSINDIVEIRQNYGNSFANFRTELGKQLIVLNRITDDDQLSSELEALSYNICETYTNNINQEIRSLKRSLGIEATIITGTLLSSYATSGMTLLGAAAAAIAGIKDSTKFFGDVRENPGYFLWKIDKKRQY